MYILPDKDTENVSGLEEITQCFANDIDITVELRQFGDSLIVERDGASATITYSRRVELFRGLSLLNEHLSESNFQIQQNVRFTHNGVMLDCSRNGVMKPGAIKRIIRHMAFMGLDTLMLYTEDTYEVPEYPYFGYMRGRYTQQELRELDAYAQGFGIDLVPCIQTLAHLQCAVRWRAFEDVVDTADILLTDEEKTYALIEAMIQACRNSFASRRIHIGMDEAYLVGLGKYRDKHGETDRTALFCLKRSKRRAPWV